MKCDLCDFVSKNSKGLKIHKRAKHTTTNKFKCDMCDFSTNNKEEETEHLKSNHAKGKTFQCDICDFVTTKKKFFNYHKVRKCLKIFLCDLGCGDSFETIEEENTHMLNIHNW